VIGERSIDATGSIEVLVTRPGTGTLTHGDAPLP
jgi:hypothetical protein